MACVVGLMFFASCDPETISELMEQKPTVAFVAGEGFISGSTSVYVGEELNFQVKVAPNTGSESELVNVDFSITALDGTTVFNDKPTLTDPTGETVFTETFTPEAASTYTVTATVTDAAGKVGIAVVTVDYVEPVVEGIGTFNGLVTINGHITSDSIAGIPAYDEDYVFEDLATTIVLGTTADGKINATLEIDGSPVTLQCTQDGNNLVFDEFHFYKSIELLPATVTLDLVMNMTGVLEDDVLTVAGTCAGTGSTPILMLTFSVNMEGTIEGSLEKAAE